MRNSLLIAMPLLLIASPLAAADRTPRESWGKAGVPFDQYRTDAVECGRRGVYMDISNTEQAQAFVKASRQIDAALDGIDPANQDEAMRRSAQAAQMVEATRPQEKMQELAVIMRKQITDCLTGRGYRLFRLTDAQRRDLKKLRPGSPERHAFLHKLASDPAVLAAQGV